MLEQTTLPPGDDFVGPPEPMATREVTIDHHCVNHAVPTLMSISVVLLCFAIIRNSRRISRLERRP